MLHGELLGRRQTKPHPLSTRRERVWLGALRRNRLTMMSRNFLWLRVLFVSAAPWTADHRGGEGSALLRWSCLQPLLCRGREFGAWSFLFHGQRRLWRGTRCRCGLSVPLPQLLLLLHHLPDLLHLLLPLRKHLLLSHLLPLLDPLAPRTSGENSYYIPNQGENVKSKKNRTSTKLSLSIMALLCQLETISDRQ